MSSSIQPGAVLGVLGGGQLGRMFTLAARRMGYRVSVLAPEDETDGFSVGLVQNQPLVRLLKIEDWLVDWALVLGLHFAWFGVAPDGERDLAVSEC